MGKTLTQPSYRAFGRERGVMKDYIIILLYVAAMILCPLAVDLLLQLLIITKERLSIIREAQHLKRKQLEKEIEKGGVKKNVSDSTRKRVPSHSVKA